MEKRFNVGEVAEFFGFKYRVKCRTAKTVTFECVNYPGFIPRRYAVRVCEDGTEWVKSKDDMRRTFASEFIPA